MKVPLKTVKSTFKILLLFFQVTSDILSCESPSAKPFIHQAPDSNIITLHPHSTFTCLAKDFFFFLSRIFWEGLTNTGKKYSCSS